MNSQQKLSKAHTPASEVIPPPPRIYSYVRFSSEKQLTGDSLRRQNELIEKYTKKNGYELDEEFRYVDLGVSAFRGKNIKEGKLKYFLDAIKENKVAENSILLIESLDRLTRLAPMEAMTIFLNIINAGVKIVTLADGVEHSNNTESGDQMLKLLVSATILCRAHDESLNKSRRLKDAWNNKRSNINKKHYTKRVPKWLNISKDGVTPERDDEKCKIVKRMFSLCLEGEHAEGIAKIFRNEKIALVAGGVKWTHSYVSQTLRNESVLGRFTPHKMEGGKRVPAGKTITDYYPAIILENDFNRVQSIMDSRTKNKGGRISQDGDNLFRKKIFCGYCDQAIHINYKGKYYKGKSRKTLVCSNSRNDGSCFPISWDYWEFEKAFVESATELHMMIKDKSQGPKIREEVQGYDGELLAIDRRLKKFIEMIDSESARTPLKTLTSEIRKMEDDRDSIIKKKESAERKMSAGLNGPGPLLNLNGLFKKLEDQGVRKLASDLISQIFDKIYLFPAGSRFQLAGLKRMQSIQVKKNGGNGGRTKAYVRDNFDRRSVRFFMPFLNIKGINGRIAFRSDGKTIMPVPFESVEDLPEDADFNL
jgi:DNA invertase Pin-like site-specific DNA recombinase